MKKRPYIQNSIADLEKIFDQNRSSDKLRNTLLYELEFRTTARAAKLREKLTNTDQPALPLPSSEVQSKQSLKRRAPKPRHREEPAADLVEQRPIDVVKRRNIGPKRPVRNQPEDVLKAWTALEVLSPQSFRNPSQLVGGDRRRIASLDDAVLPWERGEKSRPGKRLFYEILLGTIDLGPAIELLLKVYSDNRPDRPSGRGQCPIASILVDRDGRPLDEDTSFAISSFAWGVPIALTGELEALADWPSVERDLRSVFSKELVKRDRNGDITPLDRAELDRLFRLLIDRLALQEHKTMPPLLAVRRYEFFASKVPPEPSLLNSFFLEDLSAARRLVNIGQLPKAVSHYLGQKTPTQQTDLLEEEDGLRELLAPQETPVARWPGPGRYPLALLQQAAVNATSSGLRETGVLGVNGPPGTGKTTLLRDVVAARIVERATAMAAFDDPARAFTQTKYSVQRSGARIAFHELDANLKGHEIVVASSNNKAVENVSAELPGIDAIAADATTLRYFASISDNVLKRPTWGVISAVLGNASNRYQFSQEFWRNEERGLSTYLNHAAGAPQIVTEKRADGTVEHRMREVVDLEQPPGGKSEALTRWADARDEFAEALRRSKETQQTFQQAHDLIISLRATQRDLDALRKQEPVLVEQIAETEAERDGAAAASKSAADANAHMSKQHSAHTRLRPGFFARFFGTTSARQWRRNMKSLSQTLDGRRQLARESAAKLGRLERQLASRRSKLEGLTTKIRAFQQKELDLKGNISTLRARLNTHIPDDAFFALSHMEKQTASLWFDAAAHAERDRVFEASIRLHRAFIDCAADPIRQNLAIFMESFGTRLLGTPEKDALIPDLWSTFFLVVPVISTTLASVHRMFSRLPVETLGWLLIDEAGQALPQAAVGAMMRTKRSVVVGDPLQIEPVVTLPNTLTEEICGFFGVDSVKFNAPVASVQTLADAASPYCARFPAGSGHRDVGLPLLVHRRCDSPMFEISNEIAYASLMVQAKLASGVDHPLGPSAWHHVAGKSGPDKWCEDESSALLQMLQKLRETGVAPDFYVVTPFVIVQDTLRRILESSGILYGWVDDPKSWVYERVGTVHTVQGREAQIVFFVLGAQSPSQTGARGWAGGKPNLANVAVTRAKTKLYVIGNRDLWKTAGVFRTLDRLLV